MDRVFNCPSCGALLTFRSSVTVSCVCPYCRSLVVRSDVDVTSMGVMAVLPDDVSPLQIGATGVYFGAHFILIGRIRLGWTDGAWNEWFLLYDDGTHAWLAEAQGALSVLAQSAEPDLPVAPPALGGQVKIGASFYSVTDVKEITCIGSEGELPFPAPRGRKSVSIDLKDESDRPHPSGLRSHGDAPLASGGFGTLEYAEGPPTLYLGDYAAFDTLKLANLRELPGWEKER